MKKNTLEIKHIQKKMASFCAYQERAQKEVELKLSQFDLNHKEKEAILEWLKENNFLDELRFAQSYSRGKLLYKGWGRKKIIFMLKSKAIEESLIKKALEEISYEMYREKLYHLIKKKLKSLEGEQKEKKYIKLIEFFIYKGFEKDLIREILYKDFSISPLF